MPISSSYQGDLLEYAQKGYFDAIAHCCNTQCIMGAGIAAQIKQQYPEAYEADLKTKHLSSKEKLGHYSRVKTDDGFWIINLYGQEYLGQTPEGFPPLDYTALYRGLLRLNGSARKTKLPDGRRFILGLPVYLGCGLAGGHWSAVKALINNATPDIDVYFVEYDK